MMLVTLIFLPPPPPPPPPPPIALVILALAPARPAFNADPMGDLPSADAFAPASAATWPGVPLPSSLAVTSDLEQAVGLADVLVMAVPSHGFREVLTEAAAHVRSWVPVVSLAKGLEPGSLRRMSEVVAEVLPGHPVAVLTGPNLAHEILAGQQENKTFKRALIQIRQDVESGSNLADSIRAAK